MLATQSFIQNVAVLNEKLRREAWYGTFWNAFVGDVKVINNPSGEKIMTPSGSPIERLTDFAGQGRDNMLIPFKKDLVGAPVFGDTVAKGTGERRTFRWLRAYINQVRKVVEAQAGAMSELRAKKLQLLTSAQPDLSRWWSKYLNQQIYRSLYEGLSQNLSGSKDYDALGVYKRYHPNIYVNNGGVMDACGTEKQFCTAAQLDTSVAAADTGLTVAFLRLMRIKCLQLKIPQIETKNGYKFWVLVAHPAQLKTLKGETDFKAAVDSAFSSHREDHPAFKSAAFAMEGFVLFEDIVGIRGWDDATGGFYGDDDTNPIDSMFEPTAITDNYCAIVFGRGAIGFGVEEKLHFLDEVDDFENIKEVAGIMVFGSNRADYVTEALATEASGGMFYKNTTGGVVADTACINDSSAIFMTED